MDEFYIAVIGLQASILREIDIESTSQFFWIVIDQRMVGRYFLVFQIFEKHYFFKIVTINLFLIRFRNG